MSPCYALILFGSGASLTTEQVAKMTNVEHAKAQRDVSALAARGQIAACGPVRVRPQVYAITPEGMDRLRRAEVETKTSRILESYVSGAPLTVLDVESMTGIDRKRIRNILGRLEACGYLQRVSEPDERPVRLKLTEAGRSQIAERDIAPIALDAETTVKTAMRTRGALEMAWGIGA